MILEWNIMQNSILQEDLRKFASFIQKIKVIKWTLPKTLGNWSLINDQFTSFEQILSLSQDRYVWSLKWVQIQILHHNQNLRILVFKFILETDSSHPTKAPFPLRICCLSAPIVISPRANTDTLHTFCLETEWRDFEARACAAGIALNWLQSVATWAFLWSWYFVAILDHSKWINRYQVGWCSSKTHCHPIWVGQFP